MSGIIRTGMLRQRGLLLPLAAALLLACGGTTPTDPVDEGDGQDLGTSRPQYTLVLTVSPTSGGTITASPSRQQYESGTDVTLTAVPALGYNFGGWYPDIGQGPGPITIQINAHQAVHASFNIATIVYGRMTCGLTLALLSDMDEQSIPYIFRDCDDPTYNQEMWAKIYASDWFDDGSVWLPIVDVNGTCLHSPSVGEVLLCL